MNNLLQQGSNWLAKQLGQHTSDCITYSRGAVTLELKATRGTSQFESQDVDGAIHRMDTQDFLITEDLAKFRARFDEPKDNDLIFDGTQSFKVLSPGGEKPYRYSGQHRTVLRIHCKQK
jgi:hypothetical protein